MYSPSIPALNISSLRKSLNYSVPKFFVISTYLPLYPNIWHESFVSDYLPEPPTPISIMFPLGCLSTLATLTMCSIASSKKTRFILLVADML